MKNKKLMFVIASMVFAAVSCQSKEMPQQQEPITEKEPQKVLVLFYSQLGNTKAVAREIAAQLDADMEEIVMVEPYDTSFKATIDRCLQDKEKGVLPEIKPVTADLSKYDLIFIGSPVWFGTFAPPVAAFLNQADLSGKKVVPFCTFGSGGLESSAKDLAEKLPKAEVLPGYGVRAARLEAMPKEVDQFLKANGFLEGEYVKYPAFSEQHPVSAEETAIFDTAVNGYPMLSAKAKSVASRPIPEGTEYLFTAVNLPRKGAPKMPANGEIQVYVIVEKGASPVFTKVVR